MEQYEVGSKQWLDVYGQTQRSLYPALAAAFAVYQGPGTIALGLLTGSTTVDEAFAVAPLATAAAMGGLIIGAAAIGYGVGTML